jgi:hypothetical protein
LLSSQSSPPQAIDAKRSPSRSALGEGRQAAVTESQNAHVGSPQSIGAVIVTQTPSVPPLLAVLV